MSGTGYVPDAGDLIWTDFDPAHGREQADIANCAGELRGAEIFEVSA